MKIDEPFQKNGKVQMQQQQTQHMHKQDFYDQKCNL